MASEEIAGEKPPRTSNALPVQLTREVLSEAIETSGYPLQVRAARQLEQAEFEIVEEWGYRDGTTGKHRSLDIRAFKPLGSGPDRDRPWVELYIECKHTRHPWLAFRAATEPWRDHYPMIGYHRLIELSAPVEKGKVGFYTTPVSIARLLDIRNCGFVESAPFAATVARAEVNGKKIERISGNDVYDSVLLPVLDAARFGYSELFDDRGPAKVPILMLNVVVLDGPLLEVQVNEHDHVAEHAAWVRVFREELSSEGRRWAFKGVRVVEVVHAEFFPEFLATQVGPLGDTLAARVQDVAPILVAGGGEVEDLKSWKVADIRPFPRKT